MSLRIVLWCLLLTRGWLATLAAAEPSTTDATATDATAAAHQMTCNGVNFTLAEGMTVTHVAGPPLIHWPIVADWDPQGRLVVAESGGVGWPIQEHNRKRLHKLVRLVDRDGDGRFDQRIVAAEKLAFPEGVLCLGQDIFVAAPPVIWKFTDHDGDGRCEDRSIWFDGQTVTNCANDLHGPYLGRDGWLYWCKGAFGEQTHRLIDGRTRTSSAAHIYRRHPSGGPLESVTAGGMDNPVEVAMTREGERFFTSTFLQHPGNGLRDGLGHAVYGSVFGKAHGVVDDLTQTGPLMRPMTQLGPAAPSGLTAASPDFKNALGNAPESPLLVAALFNLHKLTMHRLVPKGASYETVDQDLIRTERVDVHPTDVIEDGRGGLLMIDTGGWYDLCCPTSRIDQTTASGGIYRIEPIRSDQADRPREPESWDQMTCAMLIDRLIDPRPWVQRRASQRLEAMGDEVVPACVAVVEDAAQPLELRQAAVWALCRAESPRADDALVQLITAQPSKPRRLLMPLLHAASLRRLTGCDAAARSLLQHRSLTVRRLAAQLLGRVSGPEATRPLLRACDHAPEDRHLQHAAIYALIEIGRRHRSLDLVDQAESDAQWRAALIATRELGESDRVAPEPLIAALDRSDNRLRSLAVAMLAENPSNATRTLARLKTAWAELRDPASESAALLSPLLNHWRDERPIARLLNAWVDRAANWPHGKQRFLADHLGVILSGDSGHQRAAAVGRWLDRAEADIQRQLLKELSESDFDRAALAPIVEVLTRRAAELTRGDQETPTLPQQLRWLAALPQDFSLQNAELAAAVIEAVSSADTTVAVPAARVLHRVRLTPADGNALLQVLDEVPARHLATAIEAIHRTADVKLQRSLLETLPMIPAAKTLREDFLKDLFRGSANSLRELAEQTGRSLVQPSSDVLASVRQVMDNLDKGDPVRGLQVFRSSKAACSACHKMGYIGNNIGPELTRIGRSRTREALLEAILFPSSRLEQSYRSTRVLTVDGKVYNGLMEQRDAETLKLRLDADRSVTLPLDEIELERASDVSVMPKGLGELLSRQELADLLALLQSAK